MLKCKDFHVADQPGFFGIGRKYEQIESILERVNEWISSEGISVLNVETVSDCLMYSGNKPRAIRVWYEK